MKTDFLSLQRSASLHNTEAYLNELIDKINQQPSVLLPTSPDTPNLIPFNGYYTLSNATGAFFAVDTNMMVNPQLTEPFFDLSLIICLDGINATRYVFTGSFDGTNLLQDWGPSNLSIQLTFTRTVGSYGPVASISGSVTLPGQTNAINISGTTYNNPIPAALFAGDYYFSPKDSKSPIKVLHIDSAGGLHYDGGSNNGQLNPVTTYMYNMNMFFFKFMQGTATVNIIMGTAAEQGLTCNDMTTAPGKSLVARPLVTIPDKQKLEPEWYDLSGCKLADFSGYYSIENSNAPLGFVSIQAQYVTVLPNTQWDLNFVMISYSLDGVNSQGYYFNPFTMSFDGETLNMPQQGITLKLTREYNPKNGSLVTMSGTINQQTINGSTLFIPVPLSVFGGLPLKNSNNDTLTVNNDNSVTYNNTVMNSIIYVPLMYILAYPADGPTVVMSFGTDGTHGNACIVTVDANTKTPQTTSVWAIL